VSVAPQATSPAFDAERDEAESAGHPRMNVYLINLDRNPDRLAHMRNQLNGIAFERLSALDGSNQPPTAKGLTRFELACLESHKVAWRKFLHGPESQACFLEDDLHIWPGFAALIGGEAWIPRDAHSIKLDTYLQPVELGDRRAAIGGRELARLHSRHQSSAAYILTREGAARYLELTAGNSMPADYSLFPNHPRRAGLRIYQLCPAIAIQDHLLLPDQGGKTFATAMAGADGSAAPPRPSTVGKLGRETARLARHAAGSIEWAYQKGVMRLVTTTVRVG
jgi:glycosyl transferase family 25